jgi:hypothetical protein
MTVVQDGLMDKKVYETLFYVGQSVQACSI